MRRVYRRRRIVAIVAIIAALALIGTFVWALVASVSSVGHAAYNYVHRDQLTSLSKDAVPDSAAAMGLSDCTSDQLKLTLTPTTDSVSSGGKMSFSAQLQHVGSVSCLVDASDSSRILTITSGDQTMWSSKLCPASSRSLLMSDSDKDIQTITWDTTSSASECDATASTPAAAGTYKAQLSMKGMSDVTSKSVTFQVTAAGTGK
jgi:hypothetical protein